MIKVAAAINNFASQATQTDFVSPSEESVFILTAGQLQDLIKEVVQPLQNEIKYLKATVARQNETITALKFAQEEDISRLALDIAYDRQRLAKLERIEPQPMQKERGEILRALIAAHGGKMLTKDARLKMRLSKQLFSMLVSSMSDYVEIKPMHSDKRKKVLILK